MAEPASSPAACRLHRFDFQPVAETGPWEVWFIPAPDVAENEARRSDLSAAMEVVARYATGKHALRHELFVYTWKLTQGDIAQGKPVPIADCRNPAVDTSTDVMTNSVRSNDPTTFTRIVRAAISLDCQVVRRTES